MASNLQGTDFHVEEPAEVPSGQPMPDIRDWDWPDGRARGRSLVSTRMAPEFALGEVRRWKGNSSHVRWFALGFSSPSPQQMHVSLPCSDNAFLTSVGPSGPISIITPPDVKEGGVSGPAVCDQFWSFFPARASFSDHPSGSANDMPRRLFVALRVRPGTYSRPWKGNKWLKKVPVLTEFDSG